MVQATIARRDLPFTEAIEFLRAKIDVPTETFADLWEGMHARAFVVAGAQRGDVLSSLRQAVQEALENGTTVEDFRKSFDETVARTGWSYRGARGWRTRVIFETNLRTAYAAGRWRQAERVADRRPYLRYTAVMDRRTRPVHRQLHGVVRPFADPFWDTYYPPNGWGCRCLALSVSESELHARGWQVTEPAPEFPIIEKPVRAGGVTRTVRVPEPVEPGWAYNPGRAAWGTAEHRRRLDAAAGFEDLAGPLGDLPAEPAPLVERDTATGLIDRVRRGDPAALGAAFERVFGVEGVVLTDPTGARVAVTRAILDHMLEVPRRQDGRERYWPLVPELVADPSEIWVSFARERATGRVAMRRRYVSLLRLPGRRVVALVTDQMGGFWLGTTFFRGEVSALPGLRRGYRIWARP